MGMLLHKSLMAVLETNNIPPVEPPKEEAPKEVKAEKKPRAKKK